MTLTPTARDIREHGQDRQFIIVAPENKRVMPEQQQRKSDDYQTGYDCAEYFRTRRARLGHLTRKTPNAQRPTSNAGFRSSVFPLIGCSAFSSSSLQKTSGSCQSSSKEKATTIKPATTAPSTSERVGLGAVVAGLI